jgi:hypothetical protein
MHAQLQAIIDEFSRAHDRLRQLARDVPEASWSRRADSARGRAARGILPRHQHRYLWQAERVWASIG